VGELISLSSKLNELSIPSGKDGIAYVVNVSEIFDALERINEIPKATAMTAPELMGTFTKALTQTTRLIGIIEQERIIADSQYRTEKAIALLDRVENILEEKKQKSTADVRDAVLQADVLVREYQDRTKQLEVLSAMFNSTYQDLREALYSTKKICDIYLKLPPDHS
jgi:hypothetical protein